MKDFKTDTLKQSSDNMLLRFQWQNVKDWQIPAFFGPGLDTMSPQNKKSKTKDKANFKLDVE